MSKIESVLLGRVAAIYRYPVLSMGGESLLEAEVAKLGLVGDRAYSVVDAVENEMGSASNAARKWKGLLEWRVEFAHEPELSVAPPPIRLTHSRGDVLQSDEAGFERALSEVMERPVRMRAGDTRGALSYSIADASALERGEASGTPEWPTIPYHSDPLHLLTTASLEAAGALYPEGRFAVERFRPNLVIETQPGVEGFVEKDWLQHRLMIGEVDGESFRGVELDITEETARCGLTTLPQFDLPKDPKILRTVAQKNRNQMGVYADVALEGRIRVGDPVRIRSKLPA